MQERYIFAVTDQPPGSLEDLTGFQESPVEAISVGPVTAIVSAVSDKNLRPRRKNLKVHHDAVTALLEAGTVLPMAFGTVADDVDEVRSFLERHAQTIVDGMREVEGRVEMSLKIAWQVEDLFAFLISRDEALRAYRDRMFAGGRQPTHEEKIALGQTFVSRLDAARAEIRGRVIAALSDVSEQISSTDPRADEDVAQLAILVDRDGVERLEARIDEVAAALDDELIIRVAGPIAPYSFINITLD